MKPVMQSILYSEDGPPGNCFPAAIASILEISIDDVPWPTNKDSEDKWVNYWPRVAEFLYSMGYELIHFTGQIWTPSMMLDKDPWSEVFYIANGPGPRGVDHSVVMRGSDLIHDPHPSGEGLVEVTSVEFLVPVPTRKEEDE